MFDNDDEKTDRRIRRTRDRLGDALLELFSHIAGARKLYDAMVASGRIDDFTALAEGCFARAIEARLHALAPGLDEPRLRAIALSGALLSLLRQWLPRATERTAEEMDAFFHALVWR